MTSITFGPNLADTLFCWKTCNILRQYDGHLLSYATRFIISTGAEVKFTPSLYAGAAAAAAAAGGFSIVTEVLFLSSAPTTEVQTIPLSICPAQGL